MSNAKGTSMYVNAKLYEKIKKISEKDKRSIVTTLEIIVDNYLDSK